MLRILVLLLTVYAFCISAKAQIIHSLEYDRLHGPVETVYSIFYGDTFAANYDSLGNGLWIEVSTLNCDGTFSGPGQDYWSYEYNTDGTVKRASNSFGYMITRADDEEGNDHFADYRFKWKNGMLMSVFSEITHPRDDPGGTMKYAYNNKGALSSESWYCSSSSSRDDSLMWRTLYKYNRKGQLLSTEHYEYNYDGMSERTKKNFLYDKKNRLTREWLGWNERDTSRLATYTYDDSNRIVLKMDYWDAGKNPDCRRQYTYSDTGYVVDYSLYYLTIPYEHIVTEFNQHGDKTHEVYFKPDGSIEDDCVYRYTYDPYGNWICRDSWENGEARCNDTRQIIYRKQ